MSLSRRPVAHASDDLVAAELAVRSRSLHVLASGAPVFLTCAAMKALAGPSGLGASGVGIDLYGLVFLGVLFLAWYTATRPHPIRTPNAGTPPEVVWPSGKA
ncbi:hypothetical protein [Sphaerisporangium perillae]|uniref:hypothetical protein n=1 Tax=Sphaerisporangium perillae TaxID=2935860 RepID=UPI00200D2D2F|nr:hypothetical protein [Sphaerisporangium perillae]